MNSNSPKNRRLLDDHCRLHPFQQFIERPLAAVYRRAFSRRQRDSAERSPASWGAPASAYPADQTHARVGLRGRRGRRHRSGQTMYGKKSCNLSDGDVILQTEESNRQRRRFREPRIDARSSCTL